MAARKPDWLGAELLAGRPCEHDRTSHAVVGADDRLHSDVWPALERPRLGERRVSLRTKAVECRPRITGIAVVIHGVNRRLEVGPDMPVEYVPGSPPHSRALIRERRRIRDCIVQTLPRSGWKRAQKNQLRGFSFRGHQRYDTTAE